MGTVARLLAENVSFRCTSVDRVGIRGYVPGLQYEGGLVRFLLERGYRIPSPAGLTHNHERLVSELDALVATRDVPMVRFKRDECKEDIARPHQQEAAAAGRHGLVLVGKAQERTSSWRGFVDESHAAHRPNHPHFAWRRMSSVPDHWYLYFHDAEWGPAFLKICGYAPYPLWACANGHEWAKRQLAKAGVGFKALDNGLCSVDDPAVAQRICARLGSGHLRDLLRRMMADMPDPLTLDDRRAGFDWRFSLAQLEVSDTAVFDQPRRARAWFEAAIADHLDLGRPERVSLVVNRRIVNRGKAKTPGRFATEVITRDVAPQLQVHYKSSKAKAYLKEGKALRVETTINNAADFALPKTLNAENWRALRKVGAATNDRFLAALGEGQPGLPDTATLESVVLPTTHNGQRVAGAALRRASHHGPAGVGGRLRPCDRRPDQQDPPRPDGGALEPRLQPGSGQLRPAPSPPQGLHRARRAHQHLPSHSSRAAHGHLLDQGGHPGGGSRPHRARRPAPSAKGSPPPGPRCLASLRTHPRHPGPKTSCRLTRLETCLKRQRREALVGL
ncbi:MAG TPA: hypothetical protein VK988_13285, partial [Acidimicrobiales bacterium]|nr:hypothetical protein [Acidimicrobiales bacterium]